MRTALLLATPLLLLACSTGVTQSEAPAASASPTAAAPVGTPAAPLKKKLDSYYTVVNTSQPVVAMTFDDGPHKTLTPELLDILKARGIKATFYVVGRSVNAYPEIAKRIVEEGHEIANHSYSHPNLAKLSDSSVRSQLKKTSDAIENATGVKPKTFRPPYGALSKRQRHWIFDEFGYPSIIWTVDPLDWKRPGVSVVTQRIVDGAKPGAIILAHDIHAATVEAMPGTLDQLSAQGYKFATVSDLIAMEEMPTPAPTPTPSATPTPLATPVAEPTISAAPQQPSAL